MIGTTHKPPSIGEQSFTCPHCGALAHQSWLSLGASHTSDNTTPIVKIIPEKIKPEFKESEFVANLSKKLNSGVPFLEEENSFANYQVYNLNISKCYSCNELSIWVHERVIFPQVALTIHASPDMPSDIRSDFEEARQIFPASPRGAAAILRLAVQKLCEELGEKGKNINDDIESLVKKGLSAQVKQALDIVRVIGNEAVHPGQIDLRDDPSIAQSLFELVNMIVEEMISKPKKLKGLYAKLPQTTLDAIERRDTHNTSSE